MSTAKLPVRNVSDTARWVAYFRAQETKRPDALFRDPYAKRLAGQRGFEIANTLLDGNKHEWAWVARTYLFDQFLAREIRNGTDVVLNLGAGLDARPYRMELPQRLRWIEVDLPEVLAYKEEILAGDKPNCSLERITLDVADRHARRLLFENVNNCGTKVLIATEGLLIYLDSEEAKSLAQDSAACPRFQVWLTDLASPGQLRLLQRTTGKQLSEAGAPFKFAPKEGPNFFRPYGWEPHDIQGILQTAAQLNRLPTELRALLPEPKGLPRNYPWTGVCLLKRG